MPLGNLVDRPFGESPQVRNEPVQVRSAARLASLLDAAASVVDEVGFDRLTTAMVAERAGAAIGTVYRYFPDRIAVLQALRERALERFRRRVITQIRDTEPATWWGAVDCSIDAFVEMHRNEPGFRSIRFVDTIHAPEVAGEAFEAGFFARRFAEILASEYGLPGGAQLSFRLEVTIEVADALLTRAFLIDPSGDQRFIDESRILLRNYMVEHYGDVSSPSEPTA
ncbi:TetR family transcriptional regulator [Rathayibacter iranicus]|uniref:TetR/AcrR family transcriptional regulator n=2 Tax=Rathayibacter iranicus TaxID=59737 RepID=A0AAD1ELW8_9MICO|nr:TetR family transcriptional regulator [Rathayibacter iranicus]AZZ55497.1 TetR/AcrR family transcriptional regulator [Rathayibacter iranicus]MWV31673.1 TetR family transcriptional regulator [Rathayibacter iranicus NCPPB 2253 = VKM Ac-1602]PPI48286.1 TetR/AcrR family transcriptional regulator [Rathayibacter iranicus]PPI60917.1 TetR/AcrR family transcriptional regulator [Rathayibacter iranicus]PPI72555.1 TetR/AcrR family transcriptional regulator [Rathayibacter iranicus]